MERNIYKIGKELFITSDEEIKEVDWFIHKTYADLSLHKCISRPAKQNVIGNNNIDYMLGYCKKIILTTDQELIKDGIQAIDDEFLEWFCSKNGEVNFVEVNLKSFSECHMKGDVCGCYVTADQSLCKLYYPNYKIIIPKEERKQDRTCTNNCSVVCGECQVFKPKQERMYSEEEVFKLLYNMPNFFNMTIPEQMQKMKEWFEENKKK